MCFYNSGEFVGGVGNVRDIVGRRFAGGDGGEADAVAIAYHRFEGSGDAFEGDGVTLRCLDEGAEADEPEEADLQASPSFTTSASTLAGLSARSARPINAAMFGTPTFTGVETLTTVPLSREVSPVTSSSFALL